MKVFLLDDPSLQTEQMLYLFRELDLSLVRLPDATHLLPILKPTESAVVILSSKTDMSIYAVCLQLSIERPNVAIVVLDFDLDLDIRKLMRSGVFDILSWPFHSRDLMGVIQDFEQKVTRRTDAIEEQNDMDPLAPKGKVITVSSTKGGTGKTTLAVNMATAFAKQKKKVLLIDLDLQFGDVAIFFNKKPDRTIYEWVKSGASPLAEYVTEVSDHLDVLAAPSRPEFSEAVKEEPVRKLIEQARAEYDMVLIDTAPYMEEIILTALENSDDILLLTMLDLPTLKNTKTFMDTLDTIQLNEKVKVLVSRSQRKNFLKHETVGKILQVPIFQVIPDAPKIVLPSVNEGKTFIDRHPKSKVSKSINQLVRNLDTAESVQPNKGWVAAIAGRRV